MSARANVRHKQQRSGRWRGDRKDNDRKARKEWRTKNQKDDNCHIFLVSGKIKMRLIFLIDLLFFLADLLV